MRLKQLNLPSILVLIALLTATAVTAFAFSGYLNEFKASYPTTTYPNASNLYTCLLCHQGYPAGRSNFFSVNSFFLCDQATVFHS
jgi:hypothetical protein